MTKLIKKNSTKTAIDAIPQDWDVKKLGDVYDEVELRVKDYEHSDDLTVLSLTKNSGLIPQTERFKHRIAIDDVSKYKVVKKTWLVYNPYVLWEGAISHLEKSEIGIVSPVYPVFENILGNYYFLDSVLKTNYVLDKFFTQSSGVVQRRRSIDKNEFLDIEILFPPVPEQDNIADFLRLLHSSTKQQSQLVNITSKFRQSLMHHLFTKGLNNTSLRETSYGEFPSNWDSLTVEDVVNFTQYGLNEKGHEKGTYPILRMNNIQNGLLDIQKLQFVNLDKKTFEKHKLHKDDLLFNRTNGIKLVGKTCLFDLSDDFVFASYLIRINTNELMMPEFLNFYLNWYDVQRRLKSLANRAVNQSNISASRLKSLEIAVPPIPEQEEIVKILKKTDEKLLVETEKLFKFNEYSKTMTNQLLTGKVRLKKRN